MVLGLPIPEYLSTYLNPTYLPTLVPEQEVNSGTVSNPGYHVL